MKKLKNIIFGILLIAIGLILGLNALEITNINIFFDGWWTLIIIIPCFIDLLDGKDKTGNIIGILVGVVLLLCAQNVLSFELVWKLAIPAVFVVIGLTIILKDRFNSKINDEIKKLEPNRKNAEYCATFSSQNLNFENQDFKGADLTAVFGGVTCSLYKAIINENQIINCSSIFGSIEIIVPEGINVRVKSTSIFGGVSNSKKGVEENKDAKNIYVNAMCLFGGVSIK